MTGWYEVVRSADLSQGDILFDFPAVVPIYGGMDPEEIVLDIKLIDVLVLSQSCDLEWRKVESVVLCPIYHLERLMKVTDSLVHEKGREDLRRGYYPSLHLLNEIRLEQYPNLGRPFLVASFHETFTQPLNYMLAHAKELQDRPRLCSPYREHLSQALARYFMRVGLPANIDPKRIKALRTS